MTEQRGLKTAVAQVAIAAVATYVASSGICLAQGASAQSPQGNTQNVSVVNQPTVNVAGTPAVKDADNPARQAVQHRATLSAGDGVFGATEAAPYVVPLGKRLVIDTISQYTTYPTVPGAVFAAVYVIDADGIDLTVPPTVIGPLSGSRTAVVGTAHVQA